MKCRALPIFILIGSIALAQNTNWELEEIVIRDNRISIPFSEQDRNITLLTRSQIQAAPVNSLPELLAYVSGVDIRQRGVNGMQADISLRGGTFDQVLILVNGIRMSDIQTGHHNFNLPIPLDAVKQIEIVKGPAARRFGQNAFAGAINIITEPGAEDAWKLSATGASFGTWSGGAMVNLSKPNFKQLIQMDVQESDGYRYNTDYDNHNIWYQNQFPIGNTQFKIQGGYAVRKFGANGFYASPAAKEQYQETETSLLSAEVSYKKEKWGVTSSLYWRRNQDLYIFARKNPSISRNMHIGNTAGFETNANFKSGLGNTGVGFDFRKEFLSSNNLGDRNRLVASGFLEHRLSLFQNKLSLTPGVTFSHYTDFGGFWYPGIDMGYSLGKYHRLYGNIGKTFRAPTYTDLYYQDAANEGNANLRPEEALSYEIGYRFLKGTTLASVSLFRREADNLIDRTKQVVTDKWKSKNIGRVNTNGVEVNFNQKWNRSVINQLNISYTYLDNRAIRDSNIAFSRYALDNLKHQLVANFNHKVFRNIDLEWGYRYNDRVNLDDYHLLDVKIKLKLRKFETFFQVNNLLNTSYTETNLIPMPGRWYRVGISYGGLF